MVLYRYTGIAFDCGYSVGRVMKCKYADRCDYLGRKSSLLSEYLKCCPRNTNINCDVILIKPKKPIAKDKVIKAWAWRGGYSGQINAIVCEDEQLIKGMIPCTIHISAKDYAKLEGKV